jgi:hypothetical protein
VSHATTPNLEHLHACYRSGQIEISDWVKLKAEHPELSDYAIEANLNEKTVVVPRIELERAEQQTLKELGFDDVFELAAAYRTLSRFSETATAIACI